jgi:hypothetical protein
MKLVHDSQLRDFKRPDSPPRRPASDPGIAIIAACGGVALLLITLAMSNPKASEWIAQAVQAEFGGDQPAQVPTQIAEPGGQPRSVRAF